MRCRLKHEGCILKNGGCKLKKWEGAGSKTLHFPHCKQYPKKLTQTHLSPSQFHQNKTTIFFENQTNTHHFHLLFFSPFSHSKQPLTITPKPTSLLFPKISTLTPVISSLIRFLPLNPCMCSVAFYRYCVLTIQLQFSSSIILPGEKLSFLTLNPKLIRVSVLPIVAAQARVLGAQDTDMDHHEDESNSKQDDEV